MTSGSVGYPFAIPDLHQLRDYGLPITASGADNLRYDNYLSAGFQTIEPDQLLLETFLE